MGDRSSMGVSSFYRETSLLCKSATRNVFCRCVRTHVKVAAHVADYPILVIDEEGHVLSEGRAALRRMASRTGRWRLLASSPALIVLARDEAQGTVVAAESAPKVALSGEID